MDTISLDQKYIAHTYARFPLELVRGEGSLVYDKDGKEYIDLGGGIAVNTFGIADKKWVSAVTKQLSVMQHTSNLYYSAPCVMLAEELCERTGMKRVFFSNSGAEANECAIKAARKYAAEKSGAKRFQIITLKNSFHGRTITTLAATGQDSFHNDFLPLTEGFLYVDAGDTETLKRLCEKGDVAAILFEAVQGEGGVLPLEESFVKSMFELAKQHDILTIADEVQCGNGRTGTLFGYMHYGVVPDIVSTAKGLAGGLPLGATLLGEKAGDVFTPGSHGSTFGGNPVCAAGAFNVLSRIDEKLLSEVRAKSSFIIGELGAARGIKGVTGRGLMLGIETEGDASDIVSACMRRGVLPIKAKEKVRLLPALNIPEALLKKAVAVIKNVCEEKSHGF